MATTAPFPTAGESQNIVSPERVSQTDVATLNRDVAHLRDRASVLHANTRSLHGRTQQRELDELATQRMQEASPSLLDELSMDRGLAWAHIARLVGVSVPALRKWRLGHPPAAENRRRIAELCAFMALLERFPVEEPAGWLEARVTSISTLTGLDLYLTEGGPVALLEYAGHRCSLNDLLDTQVPDWQTRFASDSKLRIVNTEDGGRSLVLDD